MDVNPYEPPTAESSEREPSDQPKLIKQTNKEHKFTLFWLLILIGGLRLSYRAITNFTLAGTGSIDSSSEGLLISKIMHLVFAVICVIVPAFIIYLTMIGPIIVKFRNPKIQ